MPSETVPITIRADKALVEKLDKIAESLDRSRNYVVTRALGEYAELTVYQLERIDAGLAGARAGRVIDADEVFAAIDKEHGWTR
jgi:predicted transcriptional regulator